jgi:prophage DNA circulation protein
MIPGSQAIAWNGTYFGKYVVDAKDKFGPDFYAHRVPHRSGAKQEQTGNVPLSTTYTLVFAGTAWADDAKRILGALVAAPRGDLVHHLFGKRRAVVMPIDAQWDPVNKGTHYQASVTFAEDTLTNNATFDRTPGTVAEDIGTATESTDVATAAYVTDIFSKYTRGIPALQLRAQAIAAQALMTDFTASTRSYAEAALFQFQAGQQQISLDAALGRLPGMCDTALTAWRNLPTVSPYAQVAITAAEQSLHQAGELARSIRENLPPPIRWAVSQQIALMTLVGKLYPTKRLSDRLDLAQTIATQNKLLNPQALRAGQILVIPAP